MSDLTPKPVVAPDLSAKVVDEGVSAIVTAAVPFIPAKVRAAIYTVGGLVIVGAGALAPVIGGTVGAVLEGIGAAAGAATSALALSHIGK